MKLAVIVLFAVLCLTLLIGAAYSREAPEVPKKTEKPEKHVKKPVKPKYNCGKLKLNGAVCGHKDQCCSKKCSPNKHVTKIVCHGDEP